MVVVCLLGAAAGSVSPAAAQDPNGQSPVAEVVAILGFANLGGDPALEWIGPGTVESVRADLGSLGLTIIAPEAVQALLEDRNAINDDPDRTAAEIGSALGARWVVSGSYQRLGTRLRLTARLYDLTSDGDVTIVRSEGPREDLFGLQDQIVEQLGARMRPARRASEDVVSILPSMSGFRAPAAAVDGSHPPPPPDVISRDAAGRATIRAVRVIEPLTIDGALDERVYQDVPAISDFVQVEPVEGSPASEQTEVWVLFDTDHIYISFRCWDSAPESQWVANEMRRDNFGVFENESIGIMFDTFHDRRNSIVLNINVLGGRMDGQVTDERDYNGDWNPIWEVRTGRFDGGWTVETAFPFQSLRYRPGRTQVWGINFLRVVRWKNEISFPIPIPAAFGERGLFQASMAPTLVGLEVPESNRTLEIKPYAITDLATDRQATPAVTNDLGGDVGLDVSPDFRFGCGTVRTGSVLEA